MADNDIIAPEIQINLHIAEYNALTNRCTYIINMQSIILTVSVTWILIFVSLWNSISNNVIIWGFFLGGQLIGWIGSIMNYDLYNIVRYIESDLKPRVNEIVKNESFWGFELYLKKARSNFHVAISEIGGVIFTLIMFLILLCYRFQYWQKWDWVGLILNLVLLIAYTHKARSAMKLLSKFWNKI